MNSRIRVMLLWGCLLSPAWANPYLDQVQRSEPEFEALERARQQLREPPPEALPEPLVPPPPFHQRPQPEAQPATLCRSCHQGPPHREDAIQRSFLNMHSRHIACESCHWRPGEFSPELRPVEELAPNRPLPQPLIAPWIQGEPVLTAAADPRARRITELWEAADEEQKARLKAQLHQPLEREGPGCDRCHGDEQPLLDPGALGFDAERARALRLNPVARFLERTRAEEGEPIRRIHLRELLE